MWKFYGNEGVSIEFDGDKISKCFSKINEGLYKYVEKNIKI